jgi:hypothetical protein
MRSEPVQARSSRQRLVLNRETIRTLDTGGPYMGGGKTRNECASRPCNSANSCNSACPGCQTKDDRPGDVKC